MSVRESYHQGLEQLKKDIIFMGEEVVDALSEAMSLLQNPHSKKIKEMIAADDKVNKKEVQIHDQVTQLIARQQPVATDLRVTIAALKMSSDLERVGDLSVDIVKSVQRMESPPNQNEMAQLLEIAGDAKKMLKKALTAYKEKDLLSAQQIASMDDDVDKKYRLFIQHLFTITNESNVEQITQLAFIGRFIERMADYATNLAEWVVYEANGQHFDLN